MTRKIPLSLSFAIALFLLNAPVSAELVISEIMAITTPKDDDKDEGGYRDEDEHLSDWIEIHNPGGETVSFAGYSITDDPRDLRKYKLPSRFSVDPDGYRVVWCSQKNKQGLFDTQAHSNFKLDRNGEYLALVNPAGEIIDEYDSYPVQYPNVTYNHEGFMPKPTPGEANTQVLSPPTHEVRFSVKSRTFVGELTVELDSEALPAGARIGYTLNDRLPVISLFSPPNWYDETGPIVIDESTQIRARVFETGKLPGSVKSENYLRVNPELADWSSNLPVIVVENLENRTYTKNTFHETAVLFLMPQDGAEPDAEKRTQLVQEAGIESRGMARQRGSSTGSWPKRSLAMEMWFDDANWADRDITPFGMPANGDWVLSGRYNFDRALMRNPLAYRFGAEMGHWAPRTQFVEVFMNQDGDELESSDYVGVYTFMEKIELGPDRINVQDPTGEDRGGFMVKVDRTTGQAGSADITFNAAGQGFVWIEPEKEFVETKQTSFLRDHFNHIRDVMRDDALAEDPDEGYRSLIDVDSWIDEYVVRTLTRDPDGFRLSTYLYMPRNGKVHYGPLWDFDRTMGNDGNDDRSRNPEAWVDYFATYGWWADLLGSGFNRNTPTASRPEFMQDWIDRYQRHRRTVLSVDNMNAIIDEFAAEIEEAQVRNFERWNGQRPDAGNVKDYNEGVTGWRGEIVHLKNWLRTRVEWMDEHYINPPGFDPPGGLLEVGATVTVKTGGTIFSPQNAYLTTDGSDPRMRGNEPSASAEVAPKTITVNETVNYVVRAEQGDRWSGPITTAFVVDGIPASQENLLITEIMYHPSDGNEEEQGKGFFHEDSFEFVELTNVGDKDMYIGDVAFTNGIDFPFSESAIQALKPGERVVFVSDIEAFELRYGSDAPVGGEFVGQLANGGERLVLMKGEEVVQSFSYNDRDPWPETPDAYGLSLALSDPQAGIDLSNASLWTADTAVGGSPGSAGAFAPAIYVNEVLANSGPEAADAVELYNPNDTAVDISGWFLTDDSLEPNKYAIPAETVIPAGEYLVISQDNDNDPLNEVSPEYFGGSFGLGSNGDEIYLLSASSEGDLTGFQDGFQFGASDEGQTFGRYAASDDEVEHPLQGQSSLGGVNSGASVGPVVISEMMYHPSDDNPNGEFIEITNTGSEPVVLAGETEFDPAWWLNGVGYQFPAGTSLASGEVLLVVAMAPDEFRTAFNVSAGIQILGPFEGRLSNGGETISVQRPGTPYVGGGGEEIIPLITVDEVDYNDKEPWPIEADGTGASLERLSLTDYGSEVANWAASAEAGGTPGVLPELGDDLADWQAEHFTVEELTNDAISGLAADVDEDGLLNIFEYTFNTNPKVANSAPSGEVGAIEVDGTNHATVTYSRRKGAAVSMVLESSTDLLEWADADATITTVNLNNGMERITFRENASVDQAGGRYLRVRIKSH